MLERFGGGIQTDEGITPEEQYIRGYQRCPETDEEIAGANAGLEMILAETLSDDDSQHERDQ